MELATLKLLGALLLMVVIISVAMTCIYLGYRLLREGRGGQQDSTEIHLGTLALKVGTQVSVFLIAGVAIIYIVAQAIPELMVVINGMVGFWSGEGNIG